MGIVDIIVFVAFVAAVLFVGLYKSKGEETHGENGAEDYFLAGRGLTWWLIGFSLIAANISAEQFVGMSGQGAGNEMLSVASWEWIAAITLFVVAFALLPYFLRSGITTIPEFLEVRYNHWARLLMTLSMILILIGVSLIGVIYAGATTLTELMEDFGYPLSLTGCCWALGVMAAIYVAVGGLKACAWADLLQGSALIVGGGVITYFAFSALGNPTGADIAADTIVTATGASAGLAQGGSASFSAVNESAMHMNNPAMPWGILLLGIWIPNFYYWGLNQYITQRILGSGSLAEGQKGLVLAAGLKLVVPFVIVIPGIIAFNLFSGEMRQAANKGTTLEQFEACATELAQGQVPGQVFDLNAEWGVFNPDVKAKVDAYNKAVKAASQNVELETLELNPAKNPFYKYSRAVELSASSKEAQLALIENAGLDAETKVAVIQSLEGEIESLGKTIFILDPKYTTAHPEKALEVKEYNATVYNKLLTTPKVPEATTVAALIVAENEALAELGKQIDVVTISPYKYDKALAMLITKLIPKNKGILGFVIAALMGAIISSLAAVLNAASTLLTMDVYQRYINPDAKQFQYVTMGRIFIGVFVLLGCALAPALNKFDSIFEFIQSFQGYVSTGILAVFIYGLINRRSGPWAGVIGLIANPIVYGILEWRRPPHQGHFLYSMSYSLLIVLAILCVYGLVHKAEKKVVFESNTRLDMTTSKPALIWGLVVCAATVALYVIFW
ncbi:MAG: sodium/solute symporter [Pontiellaceae bacterium]|nr:sodium/solute symporter [Pontiellaceae bacterium]MBN2784992.1 sodium/solute symporter [Pontiellaceae bacterium]